MHSSINYFYAHPPSAERMKTRRIKRSTMGVLKKIGVLLMLALMLGSTIFRFQ